MKEVKVNIFCRSNFDNALMMTGVPFARGFFQSEQDLQLSWGQKTLPLWWEPRSYWPDGSIKWIFLHTRVPSGEQNLVLETVNKSRKDRSEGLQVQMEDNTLKFRDINLIIKENLWTFITPRGEWRLSEDETDTDLEPAKSEYKVEIIENSPIAPLIRIKPEGDTDGFIKDQLLRIDRKGRRLFWSRRMTWNREGKYWLNKCQVVLKIGPESQQSQSVFIPEPGKVSYNDVPVVTGYPEARLDGNGYSVLVEKGWQRSPLGLSQDGNRIEISFYPEKAKNLGITGGTSYRHQVQLCWGENSSDIAGYEVKYTFDPAYICGTEAMGQLSPAPEEGNDDDFPGYRAAFKAALEEGRQGVQTFGNKKRLCSVPLEAEEDQHQDYFGLQNYGDWPWPSNLNRVLHSKATDSSVSYSNNEYDTSYSYFRGYATYGDWRYLEIARWSAIHMADVDYISTSGDMHIHSPDHEHDRWGGEMGHYWSDGYWIQYFLTGDVWTKESAEGLTNFLLNYFDRLDENELAKIWSYAERYLGWPVVALMGSYEATADNKILVSIKPIIDYIAKFTFNPDREIEERTGEPGQPPDWYRMGDQPINWWRTAMEDGCKPFMVGVVMEALERYHRATKEPGAADALVNLAEFLVEVMWCPHQAGFIYEYNALNRKHRNNLTHLLTPLFVRGLGYAYELTGDKKFLEVSEKAFHASLWTYYNPESGGKSIGQIGRTLGGYVSMAENWIARDRREYLSSLKVSTGSDFQWQAGIKKLLNSPNIVLTRGRPQYKEDALIAEGESFVAARFMESVATDCGEIIFETLMRGEDRPWENPRAYIHLCDEIHNRSCISIVSFYSVLQARVYDRDRKLIDAAEGRIIDDPEMYGELEEKLSYPLWKKGEWHSVRVTWQAPGEIVLYLDGEMVEKRHLNRPIGGEFTRIHIGYKPGNWKTHGKIRLIKLRMKKIEAASKKNIEALRGEIDTLMNYLEEKKDKSIY